MKSRLFLLIFTFCIIPFVAFSQTSRRAKIKLLNGVKIKGAMIESFDDDFLKVELANAESLLVRYDHIKSITFRQGGTISDNYAEKMATNPSLQIETFYHEFRGGLLFGDENISGSIHTINGYQFSQYLGTGLGFGLNKFGNYLTLPIYATVKGYLFDKKVSPFYFGDIGYGFAWHNNKNEDVFQVEDMQGGLYWQLGLGYQFNFYNSSIVIALGYLNQASTIEYTYYRPWTIDNVATSEERLIRRINFSIGFLF